MTENNKNNPMTNEELNIALQQTKSNVKRQATMAIISVAVTVVLCFAMTVAWYSNILHTSDLTLTADTWDFIFEGEVVPGKDGIIAAPGESGTIELSISNTSDKTRTLGTDSEVTTIGVRVNIDKKEMQTMQSRVYFYVDEPYELENIGEKVERHYLSTQDSYLYTIYPGRTLSLSDEYSNDYPLKWEWVYDVVGYYVRGQRINSGEDTGKVSIEEYIRPIVYDPEGNNTEFNSEGRIETILGQPVDSYIQENYLKSDGYEGYQAELDEYGYYEVDVDNDGYGIFIYMCTQEEIIANNSLDSTLATLTEPGEYSARIILTGQKANENSVTATSSEQLASQINSGAKIIELNGNLTVEDELIFEEGTDVMIDLKGHELTLTKPITAKEGSSIGFIDGTIIAGEQDLVWINATSSEIYIDNVIVNNYYSGIEVYDMESVEDSHIYMTQSKITTENSVVWLRGNGEKSSRKTSLVIEGCILESTEFVPVGGNGTLAYNGTDIQIMSSTLRGKSAAVYHPMSKGTMLIKNSTLTAETALAIKGGYVTIENSRISATKEIGLKNEEINVTGSGFEETGDAIYIEDNYAVNQDYEIDLVINGSDTYVSSVGENTYALRIFQGTTDHVSVVINAGKYTNNVENYIGTDKVITPITLEGQAVEIYEVNPAPATSEDVVE